MALEKFDSILILEFLNETASSHGSFIKDGPAVAREISVLHFNTQERHSDILERV